MCKSETEQFIFLLWFTDFWNSKRNAAPLMKCENKIEPCKFTCHLPPAARPFPDILGHLGRAVARSLPCLKRPREHSVAIVLFTETYPGASVTPSRLSHSTSTLESSRPAPTFPSSFSETPVSLDCFVVPLLRLRDCFSDSSNLCVGFPIFSPAAGCHRLSTQPHVSNSTSWAAR